MKKSIYLLFIVGFLLSCKKKTKDNLSLGLFEIERQELLKFIEKTDSTEPLFFEAFEDNETYYLAYILVKTIPDTLRSNQLIGYYRMKSKQTDKSTTFKARLIRKDSANIIELNYFENRPSINHLLPDFEPKLVLGGVTFEECERAYFESEEYQAALEYVNRTCDPVLTGPCCTVTGIGPVCIDYWITPTRFSCLGANQYQISRAPFTLGLKSRK